MIIYMCDKCKKQFQKEEDIITLNIDYYLNDENKTIILQLCGECFEVFKLEYLHFI